MVETNLSNSQLVNSLTTPSTLRKFRILLKQTTMQSKRYSTGNLEMKHTENQFLHAGTVEAQIIPLKGRSEGDIVQLGTFVVKFVTKEVILKVIVKSMINPQMMKASVWEKLQHFIIAYPEFQKTCSKSIK